MLDAGAGTHTKHDLRCRELIFCTSPHLYNYDLDSVSSISGRCASNEHIYYGRPRQFHRIVIGHHKYVFEAEEKNACCLTTGDIDGMVFSITDLQTPTGLLSPTTL